MLQKLRLLPLIVGIMQIQASVSHAQISVVKDVAAGASSSYPGNFTEVNNIIFFSAGDNGDRELWKTDGTAAGTVMVKDINLGPNGSYPTNFKSLNGSLFFQADDGVNGVELWKSDGTIAGTVMVKDINSLPKAVRL